MRCVVSAIFSKIKSLTACVSQTSKSCKVSHWCCQGWISSRMLSRCLSIPKSSSQTNARAIKTSESPSVLRLRATLSSTSSLRSFQKVRMRQNCFKERRIGWVKQKISLRPLIISAGKPTVVPSWESSIKNWKKTTSTILKKEWRSGKRWSPKKQLGSRDTRERS